jgi:hypothetical protein
LKTLRALAKFVLPAAVFERVLAVRSRRHQVKLLEIMGVVEPTRRHIELYGTVVRAGPFAGMIYPLEAALNRHSLPKLLGTYESELHGIIASIATRTYDCVIDIGTAEGYYATGLARLLRVPVYGYDPEPIEKSLCALMARINGVEEFVHLRDFFAPRDFAEFAGRRVLLISDCEGFETRLFTNETIPLMKDWDVLIELHGPATDSLPRLSWPRPPRVIPAEPRAEQLLAEYRNELQHWLWHDSRAKASAVP